MAAFAGSVTLIQLCPIIPEDVTQEPSVFVAFEVSSVQNAIVIDVLKVMHDIVFIIHTLCKQCLITHMLPKVPDTELSQPSSLHKTTSLVSTGSLIN